jgi:hypothetical protein
MGQFQVYVFWGVDLRYVHQIKQWTLAAMTPDQLRAFAGSCIISYEGPEGEEWLEILKIGRDQVEFEGETFPDFSQADFTFYRKTMLTHMMGKFGIREKYLYSNMKICGKVIKGILEEENIDLKTLEITQKEVNKSLVRRGTEFKLVAKRQVEVEGGVR